MPGFDGIKTWPVIEHDQNNGLERIFDSVTADYAEDLNVGDEVIVVCSDHDGRRLDFGYAFLAVITSVKESEHSPGAWLVRAEVRRDPA